MIQGGGPCRSSPERHMQLGRVRRQRITIKTERVSLYTSSTLRRENRAEKHINNPHVQGARTQDIQHDAGRPNSPTIHQVHASVKYRIRKDASSHRCILFWCWSSIHDISSGFAMINMPCGSYNYIAHKALLMLNAMGKLA